MSFPSWFTHAVPDCEATCATPSETVTAFLRACAARDLDAAFALVDAEIEYDNVPVGSVTGVGPVREALSSGLMREADEVEWVVLRQAAQGDVVLSERVDRFLVHGRWLEIPLVGVFELRHGRIRIWRDYFDLADYRRQRHAVATGE